MKNKNPSREFLDKWIRSLRDLDKDNSILHMAVSGDCDAFALALMNIVQREFPDATTQIILVSRQRVAMDDATNVLDDNPFSHVLLEVNGTSVDVMGIDADESWEENWQQPDEDDEEVPCEDVFDFEPVSVDQLLTLRQERDQRAPNPDTLKMFEKSLGKAFRNVCKTSVNKVKRTR